MFLFLFEESSSLDLVWLRRRDLRLLEGVSGGGNTEVTKATAGPALRTTLTTVFSSLVKSRSNSEAGTEIAAK